MRLVVALVLATTMSASAPATACSPPPPFSFGGVTPRSGTINVPTNAQVRLHYRGSEPTGFETDVLLQPVGGDPVSVSVTEESHYWLIVVRPDAELLPHTTYEVQTRFKRDCFQDCVTLGYGTVSTFTTGAGPVLTPTAFDGITGASVRSDVCTADACCGPYRALVLDLHWGAVDEQNFAGFRVYRDGTLISSLATQGALVCYGTAYANYGFTAASGSYVMRAVSLAGIEDENTASLQVTLDCDCVGERELTLELPGGECETGDGSGCGCAAGIPMAGSSSALLVLLALAMRAMRPRRR